MHRNLILNICFPFKISALEWAARHVTIKQRKFITGIKTWGSYSSQLKYISMFPLPVASCGFALLKGSQYCRFWTNKLPEMKEREEGSYCLPLQKDLSLAYGRTKRKKRCNTLFYYTPLYNYVSMDEITSCADCFSDNGVRKLQCILKLFPKVVQGGKEIVVHCISEKRRLHL